MLPPSSGPPACGGSADRIGVCGVSCGPRLTRLPTAGARREHALEIEGSAMARFGTVHPPKGLFLETFLSNFVERRHDEVRRNPIRRSSVAFVRHSSPVSKTTVLEP